MTVMTIHKFKHNTVKGDRVYIGRPGQWGNPFASKSSKVGEQISLIDWQAMPPDPWAWLAENMGGYTIRVETDAEAVELYRQLLRYLWQHSPLMRDELLKLAKQANESKTHLLLVCWCKHAPNDDIPCHGDVIKAAIEGIIAKNLV